MSAAPKQTTLRLVVPKTLSARVQSSLGPEAKIETKELILKMGKLTTDDIVRYIKEYTKLRDELLQLFRQMGISREGRLRAGEMMELDTTIKQAQAQLADLRSKYQRIQGEIENLERQAEDAKKQMAAVEQLNNTGFSYDEMASRIEGFRRTLGRLPAKKLEPAQKALQAILKDRAVIATGAKREGSIYLLVASPTETAAQTLQTLLLYDFVPTEMPDLEGPNLKETLATWKERIDKLAKEVETRRNELKNLYREHAESLNILADQIQETILRLRGALKLGEGTTSAYIYARLERPVQPATLSLFAREGVLEVE